MSGIGTQKPLLPRGALDWQDRAVCRGKDPALFEELPKRTTRNDWDRVLLGIAVCSPCPVRGECLRFGVENRETGVWGGRYMVEGDVRQTRVYTGSRRAA